MKIAWNEREIRNPLLRAGAAAVVFVFCLLVLPVAFVASLPIHGLLLLCGRRGFATTGVNGKITYNIDADGFRSR